MTRFGRTLACVLLLLPASSPAAPEVSKVEPPNWWPGHSINPVRLLIRGRDLGGVRLSPSDRWLRVTGQRANPAGTYLFASVAIDPKTPAGPHPLRLTAAGASVPVPFEISRPLPRAGRFQGFSPDDFIYLIMPDRFTNGDPTNDDPLKSQGLHDRARARYYHGGDLRGILNRLPYLRDLGVTAIWLTPVYDNADQLDHGGTGQAFADYHGYGAVDFYAVDEHLGDIGALRGLVDGAHASGIKVILDQVANHTGPRHPWVEEPPGVAGDSSARGLAAGGWYHGTRANHVASPSQFWTLTDPHATPATRRATLDGWFLNILPDLNQGNPEVARYLIQNTLWWAGMTGIDGIREDTLPYVPRRFWQEWSAALKREYPRLTVVGEVFDGDPGLVSFFQGGRRRFDGVDSGIPLLFDFPLYFPLRRAVAQGKPLREVVEFLASDHLYVNPSMLVTFLGLHDVPRFMNEPGAAIEGLELAFTFLLTTRGIPLLYYGDEIGMAGGGDPDNRRDFPGGWLTDPRNAFNAAERTPGERAVFDHVRRLAHFRKTSPALRRGRLVHLGVTEQQYIYARVLGGDAVIVALNNASTPAKVEFEPSALPLPVGTLLRDALGRAPDIRLRSTTALDLPARSGAVYVVGQ